MKTAIRIGGMDKKTAEHLRSYVKAVFKSGRKHGMDQSTIVEAINLFRKVSSADHASIENCNFSTGKKK